MFENYDQYEYFVAAAQLIFFTLGMGATLKSSDFAAIARDPRGMAHGLVAQWLIVPLVAAAFIRGFSLPEGVAAGVVLIAAMPGGSISNVVTYFAKGNVALSIALTASCTLASVVTIPLVVRILGAGLLPSEFQMPAGQIVSEVVGYLFVPLAIGMTIARFSPALGERLAPWFIRIGIVFLVAMIVGSLAGGRIDVASLGWGPPLTLILFTIVAHQAAMAPGRLLGYPSVDNIAVGIEANVRNINLALLLKATMFPASSKSAEISGDALYAILFYGATSLVICGPMITVHRMRARRARRAARNDSAPAAEDPALADC